MRLQLTGCVLFAAAAVLTAPAVARAEPGAQRWRITSDSLVYSDTDNVVVVSPQVAVHRAVDDDGGEASARVVVDVVSAASVDVVSQATTRFSEVRTEANLALSKAIGDTIPGIAYRYSHEPDYESHGFGITAQRRLGTPDTTLGLSYDVSLDRVGYANTPRSVFSERLQTHTAVVGVTQVIDPRTLVRGIYTLSVQSGYLAKPYRHVPLFDRAGIAAAEADGVPLGLATFDRYRLAARPGEQVPDLRVGHALGVRGLRYVGWLPGSLRLDAQVFADSWSIVSGMLEPAVQWKLPRSLLLATYARMYAQRGASFWQRTYVVDTPGDVPRWRTLDRDLSTYYAITGGVRLEWTRGALSAYGEAAAMETLYTDYLFLDSRFAMIGQAGVRLRL